METSSNEYQTSNPIDINSKNFDSEAYLRKLLKEKTLNQLVAAEREVTKEVHQLDSEMQTLVYENYNKFIAATDTIRKMKVDFVEMEAEVAKLTEKIDTIAHFSGKVSEGLNCRRGNMQRLVKASGTLKQLEYVFKLPSTLQQLVLDKDYVSAIKSYRKACDFMARYENMPAFGKIVAECAAIINDLKDSLKDSFRGNVVTTKELAANVAYLIQLGENPKNLAVEYLDSISIRLSSELSLLKAACQKPVMKDPEKMDHRKLLQATDFFQQGSDILEFIDSDCSQFLSNLGLMLASCNELFPDVDLDVRSRVDDLMSGFLDCVTKRFETESDGSATVPGNELHDCVLTTRALDRFYRRVQAMDRLMPSPRQKMKPASYAQLTYQIVVQVCRRQIELASQKVERRFDLSLTEVRQRLALMKHIDRPQVVTLKVGSSGLKSTSTSEHEDPSSTGQSLPDLLAKLEKSLVHDVKSSLACLLQMTTQDLSFVGQNPKFIYKLGFAVRQNLVCQIFQYIAQMCHCLVVPEEDKRKSFDSRISDNTASISTTLILMMSKLCHNLSQSTCGYLLDLCEQQFRISQFQTSGQSDKRDENRTANSNSLMGPSNKELESKLKAESQFLIDQFVMREGFSISQMLVKSVETRDWLGCVEPKSVRAVMKRILEDLTTIDWRLSQFLDEGKKIEKSSDSSRRTSGLHGSRPAKFAQSGGGGGAWSSAALTDTTINTTLGRLWTERVDFFGGVRFDKTSCLSGLVKICLKTFLEAVRCKTLGKFGMQQMQVDVRFLQTTLWRFVGDDPVVNNLLDEIMPSAVNRCIEPQPMEPSVVELICERG